MNDLTQYGILGIIVVALAAYVLRIEKRHKEERDEWRKVMEKQGDEMNKTSKENTSILSGLKTLLENRTWNR